MLARIRRLAGTETETDEGFGLIDLLIAITIIGILVTIALPTFLNQRKKAWDTQAKEDLHSAALAEETYFASNNAYTSTKSDLVANGYKQTNGVQFQDGWFYARTVVDDGVSGPHYNAVTPPGTGNHSFCMAMISQSGRVIWYDSLFGGTQTYSWAGCTV